MGSYIDFHHELFLGYILFALCLNLALPLGSHAMKFLIFCFGFSTIWICYALQNCMLLQKVSRPKIWWGCVCIGGNQKKGLGHDFKSRFLCGERNVNLEIACRGPWLWFLLSMASESYPLNNEALARMCFILEPSANERQSSVLLSNLDLEAHFIAMKTVITFVILCASMRCNFCLTEVIVLLDQAGIVQTIRTLVVLQGLYRKSLIFLLAVWAGSSFCTDVFRCHQMSWDVFRLSSHWQPATWSAKQLFDKVSQSAMYVNTIIVHAVDSTWHSWLSSLHINIHKPSHKVCSTRNKPQHVPNISFLLCFLSCHAKALPQIASATSTTDQTTNTSTTTTTVSPRNFAETLAWN